jgi:hypothetical protein
VRMTGERLGNQFFEALTPAAKKTK